jgi:hypothetical protein
LCSQQASKFATAPDASLAPGITKTLVNRSFGTAELHRDGLDGVPRSQKAQNFEFSLIEVCERANKAFCGRHSLCSPQTLQSVHPNLFGKSPPALVERVDD